MIVHNNIVLHNTAQNSPYNLPSYPPDNRRSSDAVYTRGGGLGFGNPNADFSSKSN